MQLAPHDYVSRPRNPLLLPRQQRDTNHSARLDGLEAGLFLPPELAQAHMYTPSPALQRARQ